MSDTIQIDKTVEIQIDYVKCDNCGESLTFNIESDAHNDLQIFTEPCKCLVNEYIEGNK